MKYYVYLLESLYGQHYYIGVTHCPEKRLQEHNYGHTRSTKYFRPWKMVHIEEYKDKKTAFKREWFLKSPRGWLVKRAMIEAHKKRCGRVA